MAVNPGTAVMLAPFANEAYFVYTSDVDFANGYAGLDGKIRQYLGRTEWLATYRYTVIEDHTITAPEGRYFGVITTRDDAVIVAFRGTDFWNWRDLLIDLWGASGDQHGDTYIPFKKWTTGTSTVLVNQNFLDKYLNLRTSVCDTIKNLFTTQRNLTKLYLTGHSLGGALATICALDIVTTVRPTAAKIPVPVVYTFGSPTVGDEAFANALNAAVPDHFRIYDEADWVPAGPTKGTNPDWNGGTGVQYPAYKHAGTAVKIKSGYRLWNAHSLTSYYSTCVLLDEASRAGLATAGSLITSCRVRITTADRLGADAGDNDVWLKVLSKNLGPFNEKATDCQQGTTTDRELTTMGLPQGKPISDLTSITLTLQPRNHQLRTAAGETFWRPTSLELIINGTSRGTWPINGVLSWYEPSITIPIAT